MGTVTPPDDSVPSDRVGFRDIYRAVGESETRIKEHISLTLLPIVSSLADHELRIRSIEDKGSAEAQEALSKARVLAVGMEALTSRVDKHDDRFNATDAAGLERRRIGGITNKALMIFMAACTFFITSVIAVANFVTEHHT